MGVPDRETALPGVFRLTGEVGGRRRSFLLHPGRNRVGSHPSSDVVLPVPGVSRDHAVLQVEAGGIEVRDAGSRNGTYVDGRRTSAGAVAPGDHLRFGPVELVVERVAPGDAILAIPAPVWSAGPVDEEVTTTPRLPAFDPATLQRWLAALDAALESPMPRSGPGPAPAVGSRLARIADELGADWAVLFRLDRPAGALRVLGAWGTFPREASWKAVETAARQLRAEGAAGAFTPWIGGLPGALLVERERVGAVQGIAVGGRFPAYEESQPLLRLLLRILAPEAPREESGAAAERAGGAGGPSPLRFPAGYVAGHAPAMRQLYRQLASLGGSSAPVLVIGETGTGKEPIARTIHGSSARRSEPFIVVNCAAIPEELLEAELFGVAAGAATGVAERRGLFLAAHRGTLLLDEIGEMPLRLQPKLLRAIEYGEVPRVGGGLEHVDVRVVAATNRDLLDDVASGAFRADLYYRIAAHVAWVPPLRERLEDLPPLVEHLLGRAVAEQGKRVAGLTAAALGCLLSYPWPGNVRELENEVRRLVAACPEGGLVDSTLLSDTVRRHLSPEAHGEAGEGGSFLQDQVDALERRLIVRALVETGGNRSQAAERLGIHRNSLAAKLDRLGIDSRRLPRLEG